MGGLLRAVLTIQYPEYRRSNTLDPCGIGPGAASAVKPCEIQD